MTAIIINWLYITLIAVILGVGFFAVLNKVTNYICKEIDICLFMGIAFIIAYAQLFSIFYKVGAVANIVLILLCLIICILCRREFKGILQKASEEVSLLRKRKLSLQSIAQIMCISIIFVSFWFIACQRAYHADTDLYHAQAIRWIEEYGVVKGLGNLHHRLAFNSAFMPLQALFSWEFLIDQSMHVANAYLCMTITIYALSTCSVFQNKRMRGSDCFRLLIFLYSVMNVSVFSSPNTDNFALLLFLYIICKWCEYIEEKNEQPAAYGLLCLLALCAVTVKLSVAMIMILTLKPAIELLKQKQYKTIILLVLSGVFILFPFCARNFIISGYFLYPSVATGFFDVDWKMLPYAVKFDKQEIMARARGIYEMSRYSEACNMSFFEWFPGWFRQQKIWVQVLTVINAITLPMLIVVTCKKIIKRIQSYDMIMAVMSIVQFVYWIMTAPRARYGSVFLFLIPCMVLFYLIEAEPKKILHFYRYAVLLMTGLFVIFFTYKAVTQIEKLPLKRSSYYVYRECDEVEWEGITMYIPRENEITGYYFFPAITYERRLQYLELRGDTLGEGFRIKEEYRGNKITTYGNIIE